MGDPEFQTESAREARILTAEDLLILFICPQCGQRARVPKRLSGYAIYCPRCKSSNLVTKPAADQSSAGGTVIISRPQRASGLHPPSVMAAEPASEFLTALPGTTPPRGSPTVASTIPFTCTKCRVESKIPAELAGKVLKCPHCQATQIALAGASPVTGVFRRSANSAAVTAAANAPTPAAGTPAAAPTKTAMVDDRGRIIFACISCTFAAYFAPGYGGKTIQCPFCGATQTIDPLPPGAPGTGRFTTPAPGTLGNAQAPAPGSARFTTPAPGTLGNAPAAKPSPYTNPGTARLRTPAPGTLGTGPVAKPGTDRTQALSSGAAPGTAGFTTPASDTLGNGPATPGTGRTQAPGIARFTTPAPGNLGNQPGNQPAANPGTGRVSLAPSPAAPKSPAVTSTGRIARSVSGNRFNTPLPGSLIAPAPGQALVPNAKLPPPPTPKPATLLPPTPRPMTVVTDSGRFVVKPADAPPSSGTSSLAASPTAATAAATPPAGAVPPATAATPTGTAPFSPSSAVAARPATSTAAIAASAPVPAPASLRITTSSTLAPVPAAAPSAAAGTAPAIAQTPLATIILVRWLWTLGILVVCLALLWGAATSQLLILRTQHDAGSLIAQTAHERQTANEMAAQARAAELHAEDELTAERSAHAKAIADLAAATAQFDALRSGLAAERDRNTALQDELAARDKVERELTEALTGPDEGKLQVMNNLVQDLVQEIAARIAIERRFHAAGLTPANATPAQH
jgi:hypothetical protein